MSSKPKKRRSEKKPEPKAEREPLARPAGKSPEAVVTARHGTGVVTRPARGYSMGEVSGAGMQPRLASRWGVRLDPRRRSVLQSNVDALKGWGSHPGPGRRAEGKVKEVERELEKVGREVKEEAVKVVEEAARAEKEVRKEVVKAEKVVRRKATKRRTKAKKKAET